MKYLFVEKNLRLQMVHLPLDPISTQYLKRQQALYRKIRPCCFTKYNGFGIRSIRLTLIHWQRRIRYVYFMEAAVIS